MKALKKGRSMTPFLRLAVFGISAGLANGLLGAGGGILTVFALSSLISDTSYTERDIFANALAVMLPISVVSAISYGISGRFEFDSFGIYAVCAMIGGIVGAIFLDRLKVSFIKKIFAAIIIWSGAYLVMR